MAKKITVTLTIEERSNGTGNANGGHYHYSYDKDVVHVSEYDTEVVYKLADEDLGRFKMKQIYYVDLNKQIRKKRISDNLISFIHSNEERQLTILTIRVEDIGNGVYVSCDPQVTNDPPTVGYVDCHEAVDDHNG
jgi:hypothetical protein